MTLHPSLPDLLLRLLLTLMAAALIGRERGADGQAAGLRTTMLVSLAAALATGLSGVLLSTNGKMSGDFSTMDVMRLPLGILTGVGFIGAGAILKRGKLVFGLTTAATLWATTVIGIVFGAGEYALGLMATALCFGSLWGLKHVEGRLDQVHEAKMVLISSGAEPPEGVRSLIDDTGCKAQLIERRFNGADNRLTSTYKLTWSGPKGVEPPPNLVRDALRLHGFVAVQVQMEEASHD